jgi:hypothetical protein
MVAYRPVTGGSPAAVAYPMPAGMARATTASPATTSDLSHARW